VVYSTYTCTSTVIFQSGSSQIPGSGVGMRTLAHIFRNHSLALPVGLVYVDDLDVAPPKIRGHVFFGRGNCCSDAYLLV
jgi:hypothetical protein